MNDFLNIYLSIINEGVFSNKKWCYIDTYNGVEKFYSKKHVEQRLIERYSGREWLFINYLVNLMIDKALSENGWKTKKSGIKNFIFHAIDSNIWIAGILQNDGGVKRLYIATVLPKDPVYNKGFYFIELDV